MSKTTLGLLLAIALPIPAMAGIALPFQCDQAFHKANQRCSEFDNACYNRAASAHRRCHARWRTYFRSIKSQSTSSRIRTNSVRPTFQLNFSK